MNDNGIILTTAEQLQTIIGEAVAAVVPRLADFRRKNEATETDGMTVEAAAQFLTAQGIPTTRASLYNLAYKKAIPFRKFGRRTVFSRRELTQWIRERMVCPSTERTAAQRLAGRINNKKRKL